MTRTFLTTATCLALALGCTPPPPVELTDADQDAIRQYLDEVARNLSPEDNEAWANGFTEDGLMMFQNAPTIRGRQAIRAWGEDTSETGSPVALSVTFSDIEIHGSGDWAWVTTSYTATFEGFEGPDHGKQLCRHRATDAGRHRWYHLDHRVRGIRVSYPTEHVAWVRGRLWCSAAFSLATHLQINRKGQDGTRRDRTGRRGR